MKRQGYLQIVFLFIFSAGSLVGQQKGYYRYPAIHGNDIVFTAEGDLWKFNLVSKEAIRLTTSYGIESHARISPDGKWHENC